MKASEFKATCLALMDEINETGEVVVVIKNGRPVAELHPYRQRRRNTPFGLHSGTDYRSDPAEISFADEWHLLADPPVEQ